jgi:hypothetical protein
VFSSTKPLHPLLHRILGWCLAFGLVFWAVAEMFFIDFVGSLLIWSLGFVLADWGCFFFGLAKRPAGLVCLVFSGQ